MPSDLNAAYLYGQLERAETINNNRLASWETYYRQLTPLAESGKIQLPYVPDECRHNAHMFYIKTKDMEERTRLIAYLGEQDIKTAFHYVPLHSSQAGQKYGVFSGEDTYTTKESQRLLRLPMYYGLQEEDIAKVVDGIKTFYNHR